jgi:hypothetical protein
LYGRNVALSTLSRPGELTDLQLDCELTIAASAPGRLRFNRYEELLTEARVRGLVSKPTSFDSGPVPERRRSFGSRLGHPPAAD